MNGDAQLEMVELGRAFEWGFFSDGVVRVMKTYKSSGRVPEENSREKKQLAKAHEFLEMVEKGEEQVDSGVLQNNAVDSIGAYRRSLSAFCKSHSLPKNEDFKPYFKSHIVDMKSGIDLMLKSEKIDPSQVESIEGFFRAISLSTLRETEKLMKREGIFPNG